MSVNLLDSIVNELQYPRVIFTSNNTFVENKDLNTPDYKPEGLLNRDERFYLIEDNNEFLLVRAKKGEMINVSGMVSKHLYSAVIKYIILIRNYEIDLQCNMILYILYYITTVKAYNKLTDKELTEGVILHLSNIIKQMIDKEDTLYRDRSEIATMITELRQSLIFERSHLGLRNRINLRR